jgi:AbrB family looped-hinge helix DNA binding protein
MGQEYRRKMGDRGQVTIPKDLRERFGIRSGDDVSFVETENGILIVPPVSFHDLARGYQERSERSVDLLLEMEETSIEADERLGDAPDWESNE